MPVFSLEDNSHEIIEYNIRPYRGRNPRIRFKVESEYPISIYLVDTLGVEQFNNNERFDVYVSRDDTTCFETKITLSHTGRWFLIMENIGDNKTCVYYEVQIFVK